MAIRAAPEPLQFMTLAQMVSEEALRMGLYGDPGVGKTTWALSAPRPLVVDTDGGLISMLGRERPGAIGVRPRGWRDCEAIYFKAKENIDLIDSILVDSIDGLAELLMQELLEEDPEAEAIRKKTVKEKVPEQIEYLAVQNMIRQWLGQLRGLNKHVILVAGVRERLGKRTMNLAPGVSSVVERWASILGEILVFDDPDLEKERRILAIAPSEKRVAKNRFADSLGRFVEIEPNPDADHFGAVWNPISEKRKTKEGEVGHG